MTIYADVLVVINLFVNYALLLCSARIMKSTVSRLRVLAGALTGSAYGLIIFLPELPRIVELLIRIAATLLIVLCTFGYGNVRKLFRCFFTFFAVSMAFGGIMTVLWMTVSPVGMVMNNGVCYFDIDIVVLAASTVVCFAVVSIISHFIERRAPKEFSALLRIEYGGKSVALNALIDTGNSLRESFSGYPVAVAERSAVEKILPVSVLDYLDENNSENTDLSMRLIIHNTVSGTGVLPAFHPDCVEIKTVSRTVKTDRIYIAVTKNIIAKGEYSVIVSPDLLSEEKKYAQTI
ncbi:MAG: sigma-E processing peptidase SpoIIGA [Clostridia bacterium]|nr:sigma-E processing peptidase SpoIIGA [Clostridia bacterium]